MFSVFKGPHAGEQNALAREIALRCVCESKQHLHADTTVMSISELRGYVRARAASVVHACATAFIAKHRIPSAQANQLIAASLERTVHLVVREVLVRPIVAIPAPHVRLRVAA